LRFERHQVGLATLIANNLEALAFPSLTPGAKVGATGITTGLATLRVAQATLTIIILFAFTKRKSVSALSACDLEVWHGYLLRRLIFRSALFVR
jgi:hypothetical protein